MVFGLVDLKWVLYVRNGVICGFGLGVLVGSDML